MKKMKRERENGFDEWGGYMAAKMSKLEDQFSEEATNFGLKEDNLFHGISIFVNGYTVPPAYELRNLMMKHGGTFHHYHRPDKTTYIIASNLPDSKLKQVNRLTVIKPDWVTDSIKARRLLNHKDYLLYTNQSKTQPLLNFNKPIKSPTKTAKDDQFLSEFYNNSRLHLISTMGATFKQYVNELRSGKHSFPGREALLSAKRVGVEGYEVDKTSGWGSVIMHIDMDCFFVSVSIRQRPDLIGKPVAVTHSKGGNKPTARAGVDLQAEYRAYHGKTASDPNHWSNSKQNYSMAEIASCSYEARQAGVKNGMFMGQALALCPQLVTLPYDFEGYKQVAKTFYDTVASYTLDIEAVSCDEMFVDCTKLLNTVSMTPLEFASRLRQEIKVKTECPCSTGFGSNKLQARLATRKAKPDGQFFLEPDMVLEFMSSVSVSDLPGVGRSTSYKLRSMGVSTCSDLQKISLSTLKSEFGSKAGETLYNYAYGKDNKSLTLEKVRKSVSAEVNYGIRFQTDSERDNFLKQLSDEVANRLGQVSMRGKSIALKIMVKSKDAPEETAKFLGHGVCDYFTKSVSLRSPTDDPSLIYREVTSLMCQLNAPSKDLRGIGIQISKLTSTQSSKTNLTKFFQPKTDQFSKKPSEIINLTKQQIHENRNTKVVSSDSIFMNDISEDIYDNPQPSTSKHTVYPVHVNKQSKTSSTIQPDLHNLSISQIDPSFLQALPDELKSEILDAVKKKKVAEPEPSHNVDKALKNDTHHFTGIDNTGASTANTPKTDLYDKISPVEMRFIIKEWIDSCDAPQSCDVDMFSSYLVSLVSLRQIDQLHILLKTFFRKLMRSKKSDVWMTSYKVTVDKVQNKMLDVYGAKLIQIQ